MQERPQHDWEQIDQGTAYCLTCPENRGSFNDLSANPQTIETSGKGSPPQPKSDGSAKVSHGSKDHEIENLKRLLAEVSQRLDKLK